MNWKKLKDAEELFLGRYPGGFENPEMLLMSKKYKAEKMQSLVKESFAPDRFGDVSVITDKMVKVVTRSAMVSVFEKPKYRDYLNMISDDEKSLLARGLNEFLHGNQQAGFDMTLDILKLGKLAKWTLMTIIPVYYKPLVEVYVKPTTAKNILTYFEVPDLKYTAKPNYEFYRRFRDLIGEMKSRVDNSLCSDNAAFTGFLMMSMQ